MICEYGCGREAKFPPHKGTSKWCCKSYWGACPEMRRKNSKSHIGKKHSIETRKKMNKSKKGKTYEEIYGIEKAEKLKKIRSKHFSKINKGKDPWNKNKTNIYSKDTIQKISLGNTYNVNDYKIKYPIFYNIEKPIIINEKLFIKCKHCNKQFNPSRIQLTERLRSIKNNTNKSFFYCSDECKHLSEFFNRKVDPITQEKFRRYSSIVWSFTNKTLKNYNIDNIENRGRNKLHLDHKFSILEGFNRNIEPELLANHKNLEMIPEADNIRKGSKCSISLSKLLSFK